MKLIIDIPDELFSIFKKHGIMAFDYFGEYDKDQIAIAIAQSTPYNPSGDCISREALKEAMNEEALNLSNGGRIFIENINKIIDNAPTVEPVIKCPDCKFYRKKWFVDRRMKEKGYWNCWCECHDYWVGGENGFCSLAEKKGGAK